MKNNFYIIAYLILGSQQIKNHLLGLLKLNNTFKTYYFAVCHLYAYLRTCNNPQSGSVMSHLTLGCLSCYS